MNYVLQGLLIILGFGSVLFLAYVTTRYIAGKSGAAMRGRYINIVETVSLGPDKRLYLVKVDRTYVLLASSSKNIEFLSKVDIDEAENIAKTGEGSAGGFNFRNLFEKYIQQHAGKKGGKTPAGGTGYPGAEIIREDPFKSNLERLKSLTQNMSKRNLDGGDEYSNEKR